jgi:hypothetical protein
VPKAGTMGCRKDSLPDGSEFDANDDETTDTDAARLGDLDAARCGRDPRVRGVRLDAGPFRPPSARSSRGSRPPRSAAGVSPDAAVAQVREVLDSIGDLCPECPTLGV